MAYKSGDFIELPNGRSVRLNKDTAEIANAGAKIVLDRVSGKLIEMSETCGVNEADGIAAAFTTIQNEAPE